MSQKMIKKQRVNDVFKILPSKHHMSENFKKNSTVVMAVVVVVVVVTVQQLWHVLEN